MRITFILPDVTPLPNGGVRVVYEYANRLAERGHAVTVMHPRTWIPMQGVAHAIKARLWPAYVRRRRGGGAPWMTIHKNVRQQLIPDLRPKHLPDADAVVATFFRIAPYVYELPISKGRKFFLIQSYEIWAGTVADVNAAWKLPMRKVAISLSLMQIAEELGIADETTHIPNGMDLEHLRLRIPVVTRRCRIAMPYHHSELKGSADGISALNRIKAMMPEAEAILFGVSPRDDRIPDWIEYKQLPSRDELAELYNSASIFLQPSHTEGWGLTSTEAMACGCALVTTDNGGSRDYAFDGETAMVSKVGDVDALVYNIVKLLRDHSVRCKLALDGEQVARRFTWARAVNAMESVLANGSWLSRVDPVPVVH